ncbi:MAG: imidazole glycerol phosphate synthase subunit HisF [Candidatus Pelagibacter sp. TMED273]|nr:MAG: imidazole glycerol phosphate synthase subunit HisF [Candidatus Pelagibacter sp. TMED273]
MLKKRIIPKFLFQFRDINGQLLPTFVISRKFSEFKIIGSVIPQAKIYEAQLADELMILNIENKQCSKDNQFLNFLKKFSEQIFMPLTVGGGVKTLECFENLLNNGADKVFINSEAINNPDLIKLASEKFGSQCVVLGIDFKELEKDQLVVFSKGGKINTNLDLIDWAKRCEQLGAGEIALNDIDRDGTSTGLNIKAAKKISELLSIPIIFSGGCGLASHFVEGFKNTNIDAISAGTFFANRDQNVFQLRSQILNSGINLRQV